jgi:hypothetical protein
VAQGEGPEFKPKYCKTTTTKQQKNAKNQTKPNQNQNKKEHYARPVKMPDIGFPGEPTQSWKRPG